MDQSAGTQFKTPMMAMVHLVVLVEQDHFDRILELVRGGFEGNGHENERLLVSDVTNGEALSPGGPRT